MSATKTALVTGASGALGGAVVERFKNGGFTVSTPSRDSIPNSYFDVAIHCAGGFRFGPVDSMSLIDFQFLMQSNFESSFKLLQTLLPAMKEKRQGRFVFVGSSSALVPSEGVGVYSASKAALHALVQSAAKENAPFGININAVLPAIIDTPANRAAMSGADFTKWVRLQSLVEIIFELVALPAMSAVSGALIPVMGGVSEARK